jgi:hypothetical protein
MPSSIQPFSKKTRNLLLLALLGFALAATAVQAIPPDAFGSVIQLQDRFHSPTIANQSHRHQSNISRRHDAVNNTTKP